MQIRQLEQQAGLALTEQFGKQVHLTEAGTEVYRYTASPMDDVPGVISRGFQRFMT